MSVINSYAYSNADGTRAMYGGGGSTWVGQSFSVSQHALLDNFKVYLSKSGSPTTGFISFAIYTHSGTYGTSSTRGSLLATATTSISPSGLTTTPTEYTATFADGTMLDASTNYVLVISFSGGDLGNKVLVSADSSSPSNSGNASDSNNGAISGTDLIYQVNGRLQTYNFYYFDGHVGYTDVSSTWTNDANAMNGSTADYARTTGPNGSTTTNYLQIKGTNAPTSGGKVSKVYIRVYAQGEEGSEGINFRMATAGEGVTWTTTQFTQPTAGYSSRIEYLPPAGGWDWGVIDNLEAKLFVTTTFTAIRVYNIELLIFESQSPTVALSSPSNAADVATLTPTLAFAGTDTEAEEITYQLQVGTDADFVDAYNNVTVNSGGITGSTTGQKRAQSFTAGVSGKLRNIRVYLRKTSASFTDAVVLELWSDSSGSPGSMLVRSDTTIAAADMRVGFGTGIVDYLATDFAFSGYSVTSSTKYWVVLYRTGTNHDTNYFIPAGSTTTAYGSEVAKIWSGSAWTTTGLLSMWFREEIALVDAYSDIESDFVDYTDGADYDPFDSGDTINYAPQVSGLYYFDGNDGISDPLSYWNSDSSAFDGSFSISPTFGTAATVAGEYTTSKTSGYLQGKGTNTPSLSGVTQVRIRVFPRVSGQNFDINGTVYTGDLSQELGTARGISGLVPSPSSWVTLSAPSGGWTSTNVNELAIRFWSNNLSDLYSAGAIGAQLEVTSTPVEVLANTTTYYWRVRGKDPSGTNLWGPWSTIRSFNTNLSATKLRRLVKSKAGGVWIERKVWVKQSGVWVPRPTNIIDH